MAGLSHYQARGRDDRILRAPDMERELLRLHRAGAHGVERRGGAPTFLLIMVVLALLAFIGFAGDGEGGLAIVKAFTTLFR